MNKPVTNANKPKQANDNGFYHKNAASRVWKILAVILLLTVLPEFFVDHYPHFKDQGIYVDASRGFYIWFTVLSCVVFIVVAKVLGIFLKRRDGYYHE